MKTENARGVPRKKRCFGDGWPGKAPGRNSNMNKVLKVGEDEVGKSTPEKWNSVNSGTKKE